MGERGRGRERERERGGGEESERERERKEIDTHTHTHTHTESKAYHKKLTIATHNTNLPRKHTQKEHMPFEGIPINFLQPQSAGIRHTLISSE